MAFAFTRGPHSGPGFNGKCRGLALVQEGLTPPPPFALATGDEQIGDGDSGTSEKKHQ